MIRKLLCIAICIMLLLFFTSRLASAQTVQDNTSFISFLKNYLIAYTIINSYNHRVLAAHTKNIPTLSSSLPSRTPLPLPPVSAYLLSQVNTYRQSLGLSFVQSTSQTCSFAALRAQEIAQSFTHNGFYNRVTAHTIPYTKWSHATENIAETPDYKEVVTLWENSPGHAANMRDSTPYVCIMQYGNYFAYEGMRL